MDGTEEAVYRFTINPLVWWVWFGGFVLAFGGIVTMWPGGGPTIAVPRRVAGRSTALRWRRWSGGGVSRLGRRMFVGRLGAAVLGVPGLDAGGQAQAGAQAAGRRIRWRAAAQVGTLRDPGAAGRPRAPTEVADYDERIQAIEHRLACNCGCTLDVFTCRTTDFTCTYSPKLHREVVALDRAGKTAQEILDAFVEQYGEKALMAPKPEGFNLWGYLLPGSAIVVAGGALVALLARRRAQVAAAEAGSVGMSVGSTAASVPGETTGAAPGARPGAPPPTAAELERLQRALAEVED